MKLEESMIGRIDSFIKEGGKMPLVTCNFTKKGNHCKYVCPHGDVHERDIGKDSCLSWEFCDIVGKRVHCRKLYKKEILNG